MKVNVSSPGLKAKRNAIVERTLRWWDRNRRELPWRAGPGETPDPYRVWLSEVLLQQTTAQAAAPYFQTFVETWPTVEDLAAASTEAVIGAFAGLGYYSRARNLHDCAKEIARRGGCFPDEEADLRALAGRWRLHGGGYRRDRLRKAGGACRWQHRSHSGAPSGVSTSPLTRRKREFAPLRLNLRRAGAPATSRKL